MQENMTFIQDDLRYVDATVKIRGVHKRCGGFDNNVNRHLANIYGFSSNDALTHFGRLSLSDLLDNEADESYPKVGCEMPLLPYTKQDDDAISYECSVPATVYFAENGNISIEYSVSSYAEFEIVGNDTAIFTGDTGGLPCAMFKKGCTYTCVFDKDTSALSLEELVNATAPMHICTTDFSVNKSENGMSLSIDYSLIGEESASLSLDVTYLKHTKG